MKDVADRAVLSGCVGALQNDEQCPLSLSVEMSCSRFISAASFAVAFSVRLFLTKCSVRRGSSELSVTHCAGCHHQFIWKDHDKTAS